MKRLIFGWDFEGNAKSRSWNWNLTKTGARTCVMNSTLGSVVPLAMFHSFRPLTWLFTLILQKKSSLLAKTEYCFWEYWHQSQTVLFFSIKYSFEVTLENFCVGFIDCFGFGEAELTFAAFSPTSYPLRPFNLSSSARARKVSRFSWWTFASP